MEFSHDICPAGPRQDLVRRSTNEWLALGALGLLGCLLSLFGVLTERQLILRDETDRLEVQARIVDENLRRQMQSIRGSLDSLRRAAPEHGDAPTPLSFQTLRSAIPGVRAIMALDAHGKVLQSSGGLREAPFDDREFLHGIASMRDPQTLYVARPHENTPGEWTIKLSMTADQGQGRGAITAILDTTSLDVVTQSAVYAPDMSSAIVQEDGFVVASVPPGAYAHVAALGATARPGRLEVRRTIPAADLHLEKPLVVTVSRNYQEMNRPWMRLALEYGVAWCLFALVCSIGLYVMQKKRAAFTALAARRDAERTEHAQRIELTLVGANLNLWELELTHSRMRIDRRAAAVIHGAGAGASEQEWHSWRDKVHPQDLPAVEHALATHLGGRRPIFESEHRIHDNNGGWVWVLARGRVVERNAMGQPLRLLGTCMDISDRKRHEAEIERLAFYDGLTGLPNRRLLRDRLEKALATNARAGQCGAVLFIDLDHFKDLNDTLGHDRGDMLLCRVSARLLAATRKSGTVARLGGDEFVVLLERLGTSREEAAERAEHVGRSIVSHLSRPYILQRHQVHSTPSIGIALFGLGHNSVDELLKQADLAMYQAKSAGRSTLRMFDPQMQATATAGAELEFDLRDAQQRGEMALHYQLIVDANGSAVGAEALLRWNHPRRGVVSPTAFVPIAEKSGLILSIGAWVLDTACAQLRRWTDDAVTRHLTVSVNVSARQLRQDDFVEQVVSALQRHSALPSRLKLELTESMLLNDVEDVIGKMKALKAIGIGLSLDDFGTGYSSLGYLRQLPLDQLKIDQSFVREVLTSSSDASIAKAIIGMARSLGLRVVAEGVETEAQRRFLLDNGCDLFQGYMFSMPGPPEWVTQTLPTLGSASGLSLPSL